MAEKRFGKAGALFLVISLVLGITFFIVGIVLVSGGEGSSDRKDSSYTLYEGSSKYISADSYEYYTCEFTPDSTGYYYIMVDGANVSSVYSEDGDYVTKYTEYSYSYDHCYEVYLYSYETYEIELYSNDYSIYVLVDDNSY